ncbi:hypothetical protein NVP1081O_272 [Vibrio phage 1.081.O._10N.286.52.C2]|nr:hypothetical protein NVP1081O_272 [Vibrio phage 1.081.O._10N.286.52.C2]
MTNLTAYLLEEANELAVLVELENGARYALQHHFDSVGQAEHTIAKINKAQKINLEYWSEIDPCYGSERHSEIGDFHLMAEDEFNHGHECGYW